MADPPPVTGQAADAQAALYATLAQSVSVALKNIVAQQQQIIVLGQTAATAMQTLLNQSGEAGAAPPSGATRPPLDPASIKLMGYSQVVRGHVDSIARGINVPNAQPDQTGLASVNPIFTWVRLAQRVPVRIHIDQTPDGVRLVSGMTATVQIHPRAEKSEGRTP